MFLLLEAMLAVFKERGWLKQRQSQRTDSTHVLAKVRATGGRKRSSMQNPARSWRQALHPPKSRAASPALLAGRNVDRLLSRREMFIICEQSIGN